MLQRGQRRYHVKSPELRLIRPQIQQQNPVHTYLKLLKPLTPSVEKTVNLHAVQVILCFVNYTSLCKLVN
jgi:hypothetical protein